MSPKPSLPLIIAASVISGGLAGAVIGAMVSPDAAPRATAEVVTDPSITHRLSKLEQRLDALGGQLTAWQHNITPTLPLVAGDKKVSPHQAIASLERRIDDVVIKVADTFENSGEEGLPDAFETRVAEALHAIRHDEEVEGWRDHVQGKRDRLDESMAHITNELELDQYQQNALRQSIVDHYDREDAQIDMWSRGAADDIVGEQKRTDGELFASEIASFLSEEQMGGFWEIVYGPAGKDGG